MYFVYFVVKGICLLANAICVKIALNGAPFGFENSVFYFPLVTCLLLSGLLSLVMWLFNRK